MGSGSALWPVPPRLHQHPRLKGDGLSIRRAWDGLALSNRRMGNAGTQARLLAASPLPAVRVVALRAAHLLDRVRIGWNEMGLWMGACDYGNASAEVLMADEELRYRLSVMERDCLALQADLDATDAQQLAPLWRCLAQ